MIKSGLLTILFIITYTSYGQKVKPVFNEDKKEVTIDGEYYINMEKMSGGNLGMAKNYSFSNEEGDELIFMKFTPRTNDKNETSYWYEISFPGSGSWLLVSTSIAGMGKKGAMKKLVKHELIKNGDLDWNMAKRYLQRHHGTIGIPSVKEPSKSPVTVVSNEIYQDGEIIGKVIERHTETERIYHVYNISGDKVMVASLAKKDPMEWTLTSNKGDTFNVLYEGEQDGLKILTYMASKGWLKS